MILFAMAFNENYLPVFFKNIRWAFQNYKTKICVMTYKEHNIKPDGFDVVEFDKPKIPLSEKVGVFFHFHNHTHNVLQDYLEYDHYVFLEIDVLFTKIVTDNYFYDNKLSLFIGEKYLSILDSNHKVIYPRVWEACLFVPHDILLNALNEKIQFGNSKQGIDHLKFDSLFTEHCGTTYELNEFVHSGNFDTMFALTLWCFNNKVKVLDYSDHACEFGKIAIHFRGFEILPRIVNKQHQFNLNKFDDLGKKYINYLYLNSLYNIESNRKLSQCNIELKQYIMNKIQSINTEWMDDKIKNNHQKFANNLNPKMFL